MHVRIYQGHTPELERADVYVVIDVIRAFTTACVAFLGGVSDIVLAGEIEEAWSLRGHFPHYLLAGERKALRIEGFDLGNSPFEMDLSEVAGKGLIFTTTNGVRATLHAIEAAQMGGAKVAVSGLMGAEATARWIAQLGEGAARPLRVGLLASHPDGDDDLACAQWIEAMLLGREGMSRDDASQRVMQCRAARKFWDPEQPGYRPQDIEVCVEPRSVDFVILARREGFLARLAPVPVDAPATSGI